MGKGSSEAKYGLIGLKGLMTYCQVLVLLDILVRCRTKAVFSISIVIVIQPNTWSKDRNTLKAEKS